VQDRKDGAYRLLLQYHAKRHSLAEGILLNSFMDLEADTIEAMQNEEIGKIPHINPVGPIIQSGSMGTSGSECLKYWFDNQPKGSVLYVSLGVERLSFEQLNELAIGLEMNKQKFLWVVRSPDT